MCRFASVCAKHASFKSRHRSVRISPAQSPPAGLLPRPRNCAGYFSFQSTAGTNPGSRGGTMDCVGDIGLPAIVWRFPIDEAFLPWAVGACSTSLAFLQSGRTPARSCPGRTETGRPDHSPRRCTSLPMHSNTAIGIDFGGTTIKSAVVRDGQIVQRGRSSIP